MKVKLGNDGVKYVLADGNYFTTNNGGYWMTSDISTVINLTEMHTRAGEKATTHVYSTDAVLSSLYYNYDYEHAKEIAESEWYWLFGSVLEGGMGFVYLNSNEVQWFSYAPTASGGYYASEAIHKNNRMFILDMVYFAGQNLGDYSAYQLGEVDAQGNFLGFPVNCYWFNTSSLEPALSIATVHVENVLLSPAIDPITAVVQPDYDVVGVAVNNGDDNGAGKEIGDHVYGFFTNPYIGWNFGTIARWMDFIPDYDPTEDDPYADGGYEDTDGGGGEIRTVDDIDFPSLPPSLLLASGIVKIFNPSIQEMNQFVNYIYSSPDSVITNFKKIWVNPMDSIISLSIVPFALQQDTAEEVKFCGVSSGIYMHPVLDQYVTIDCGTLHLQEEFNSLLDYNSYTKAKLFLPFFGFVDLNVDDIMDADIHIKYNIDILTGESLAIIKCSKVKERYGIKVNSCIYQFKGNVLTQVPLTGNNYQQLYSGVLNLVSAVALPNPASVAGVATEIMSQKVTVQRGGSITGNGGALGEYTPYLVLECPVPSISASTQRNFIGYPFNKVCKIGDIKGYTEVEPDSFRISDIDNITDTEAKELIEIIEGGFIA